MNPSLSLIDRIAEAAETLGHDPAHMRRWLTDLFKDQRIARTLPPASIKLDLRLDDLGASFQQVLLTRAYDMGEQIKNALMRVDIDAVIEAQVEEQLRQHVRERVSERVAQIIRERAGHIAQRVIDRSQRLRDDGSIDAF